MKKQVFGAVLAAAAVMAGVFLSACALFRDTTDSVLDNGEDAIATNRAASRIDTAEFMYELDEDTSAQVRYRAPDKVRIDVLDGKRTLVFCLNGASGWMYIRGDVIDMTADDIAEMHASLLQAIPFNVNFQDIFGDAELQEETEFACGEECNVIHANFRRNPEVAVRLWFGIKSDLMRQCEITRDDGVYTTQYFDYCSYGDITLPVCTFNFSPQGATKLTLLSFEENNDIPEYVFRKPEKLSALEGDK